MNKMYLKLFMCILLVSGSSHLYAQYPAGSPVALNGKLKVVGSKMQNECGVDVQLKGMSTHGLQWFEGCLNNSSLNALTKDWKIDLLRLAMYPDEDKSGYVYNREKWKTYIDNMVDECQKRGIYCMIDWHVLKPGDPNAFIKDATEFWKYMSTTHAGKDHVLYEIANEPNGVNWTTVKTYAQQIIPLIRANDPSTIIIVGTPNWSQDVDIAANDKLAGSNIMYALHFYAAEHKKPYRDKADAAIAKGAALFVTEFGTSKANGTDAIDLGETEVWMNWMNQNKIGWANWSFADKDEVAAALKPGVCATGGWNQTTPSGTFIKGKLGSSFSSCASVGNIVPPTISISTPARDTSILIGSSIDLAATVTGSATSVAFYNGNTLLGTDASAPYTYTLTSPTAAVFVIKARAIVSEGVYGLSNIVNVYVNPAQSPFTTAPNLSKTSTKIEAENYDKGGNMNAYYDKSAGNIGNSTHRAGDDVDIEGTGIVNVGFTQAGEWLEYSVNVEGTTEHTITVNAASKPGGTIHIEVDGKNISGPMIVAPGDWTTWTPITKTGVVIPGGSKIIRLVFETNDVNVDFLEITRTGIVSSNFSPDDVNFTSIVISPNPTSNTFSLRVNESIKSLLIVNVIGSQVTTMENVAAGQNIDLGAGLDAGTYFMHVQYAFGKSEVHKLMKVK